MDNLKFLASTDGQYKASGEIKYIAPAPGYYQFKTNLIRYEPTGELETVPNHKYAWYRFWEPKTIEQEKWRQVEVKNGCLEVAYFNKGDEIPSEWCRL